MNTVWLKRAARPAAVAAVAAAVSVYVMAPANAASDSGSITCNSTFQPRLNLDSASGGTGHWQNRQALGQITSFSWAAGGVYKYSPYQKVNWDVTSATAFRGGTPTGTCVQ